MEAFNRIKVHLSRFLKRTVYRSRYKPVKAVSEANKVYLVFENIHQSHDYIVAESQDGYSFTELNDVFPPHNFDPTHHASAIPERSGDKRIMYFGDRRIYLATSSEDKPWHTDNQPLFHSPHPTQVGGAFNFQNGILLLYYEKYQEQERAYYRAYFAEFDAHDPSKLLWKMDRPVWDSKNQWREQKAVPLGAVLLNGIIYSYWHVQHQIVYAVLMSGFVFNPQHIKTHRHLHKHISNPILSPKENNKWEAFTTLNPAAAFINHKVHILYRAQGYDYISTIGYAISSDGVNIEKRYNQPIYGPSSSFESNKYGRADGRLMSAGGFGGCEDPRITVLGDRVYMVYVAFDGWSSLRLALTSIDIKDFLAQRWNWAKPILVSPPGIIDKSGCLLPEKINNKYVFFHRVFPNILIDYVNDLNFKENGRWLRGEFQIKVRPGKWDSRKIGVGAPPMRTQKGWLLIYYGVDDRDASKYHIGAMLLDLKNPIKVLHRTDQPILSPTEEYEINGFKPGIAYPCGAVIIKNELFVYYGAADSYVCVAKANLHDFLMELTIDRTPKLQSIEVKEITIR